MVRFHKKIRHIYYLNKGSIISLNFLQCNCNNIGANKDKSKYLFGTHFLIAIVFVISTLKFLLNYTLAKNVQMYKYIKVSSPSYNFRINFQTGSKEVLICILSFMY